MSVAQETSGLRRQGCPPCSRYSCQHPHSPAVHGGSPLPLRPAGEAPLPTIVISSRRFGTALSPVYCRRAPTRPVSCYALFEGVAASKPTSWLSVRAHILCHSTRIWGPWRAVRAVSLSGAQLSPRVLTAGVEPSAIRSSARVGRQRRPLAEPVLYLRWGAPDASPKAISGRTRYLRV